MARKRISYEYSSEGIRQHVLRVAKSVRVPEGWAEQIAERVVKRTDDWIKDKDMVTEGDLRKIIGKELDKIAPDIAFAYKNHDKII
jgi:2-phosphoglycerate kinase